MASMNGLIEPNYFLITAIAFAILSIIQYKKVGKTLETIYLSILFIFFFNKLFYTYFWWLELSPSFTGHSQKIKKQLKSDTNRESSWYSEFNWGATLNWPAEEKPQGTNSEGRKFRGGSLNARNGWHGDSESTTCL